MNPTQDSNPERPRRIRRRTWIVAGAVLVVLAPLAVRRATNRSTPELGPLFTLREGPLSISVVSAGTVQSRRNVSIRSEVEGRNTVIWLVDDGKAVTNGELLVELDTSSFVDKRTDQQILVGNGEAGLAQASEKLAIARNEQEALVAEAELKLHLAKLDQAKYLEGEFPQLLQEAESKIALAHEEVERASDGFNWSQKLAGEGYLTRTELQADALSLKQKQSGHAAAVTALNVLTNYTALQQRATLASNLRQAEMALDRVVRQTRADVIQAETDLRARDLEFARQKTRLEKLDAQVRNCRIVAPTNGVVIYTSTIQSSQRRWGNEPLQTGAQVVERQDLMQIPVDGGMMVEMSVPESSLTKLRLGQIARIKVDAVPGRVFAGRLNKIGILPDGRNAWLNPDLKLYNCTLELGETVGLRAGMSCEVELLVEEHASTLYVPVQCVLRVGEEPTVYVAENGRRGKPRKVKVGLDNNRVVHVLEGLRPGERVLMNPPLEAAATAKGPRPADAAAPAADAPAAAVAPAPAGAPGGNASEAPAAPRAQRAERGGRDAATGGGDRPRGSRPQRPATSDGGEQP